MHPNSAAIVFILGENQLAREAEQDLAAAGFTVVMSADQRKLLDNAIRHTVLVLVVAQEVSGWLWSRWKRTPHLRRVPIVVIASRPPQQMLYRWPLGAFLRADAYLGQADLNRPRTVAEMVSAALSRVTRAKPTPRERFGEGLWYVGSILSWAGLLAGPVAIAVLVMRQSLSGMIVSAFCTGVGAVLMDVGGAVGLRQGLKLRRRTWVWIVVIPVTIAVLLAQL